MLYIRKDKSISRPFGERRIDMSIRLKKEDFLKKEKLEVPETLKEELVNDEYD